MSDLLQPPSHAATTPVAMADAARWGDDLEFALGCECANPALQFGDQWWEEAASPASPSAH